MPKGWIDSAGRHFPKKVALYCRLLCSCWLVMSARIKLFLQHSCLQTFPISQSSTKSRVQSNKKIVKNPCQRPPHHQWSWNLKNACQISFHEQWNHVRKYQKHSLLAFLRNQKNVRIVISNQAFLVSKNVYPKKKLMNNVCNVMILEPKIPNAIGYVSNQEYHSSIHFIRD